MIETRLAMGTSHKEIVASYLASHFDDLSKTAQLEQMLLVKGSLLEMCKTQHSHFE